ncbi:hypothetical protein KKE45_00225 [Patescibacteria group bacterium]|nr:hypothetical protein [Patescibacteria group bacterium]
MSESRDRVEFPVSQQTRIAERGLKVAECLVVIAKRRALVFDLERDARKQTLVIEQGLDRLPASERRVEDFSPSIFDALSPRQIVLIVTGR